MKKSFILLVLLVLAVNYSFSQTSEQDYNYVKKGYWYANDNGFALRTDVNFKLAETRDNVNSEFRILRLSDKDDKKLLCLFLIIQDKKTKEVTRITIPSAKSESTVKNDFYECFSKLSSTDKFYTMVILHEFMAF